MPNVIIEGRGTGYIPDLPKPSDYKLRNLYAASRVGARDYGPIDLRDSPHMFAVGDQAEIGSCVPFSVEELRRFVLSTLGMRIDQSSVLFLYYAIREAMGTVPWDSGSYPRLAYDLMRTLGIAPTEDWPYDTRAFRERPPTVAYEHALERQLLAYFWIDADDTTTLMRCLHDGFPFTVAMPLYSSWRRIGADGMVPMPDASEGLLGGHQMVCVGRRQVGRRKLWIVRNQWGTGWGDDGDAYFPDEYRRRFWRDARTVRDVEPGSFDPVAFAE